MKRISRVYGEVRGVFVGEKIRRFVRVFNVRFKVLDVVCVVV